MAKLSKDAIKRHTMALEILRKDKLTDDDRETVFRNYNPGAEYMNGAAGAFFTPFELAGDFSIELNGCDSVIDLCAGIGVLSMFKYWRTQWDNQRPKITCVEINPAYCEIGKKLVPWATWICCDVFDLDPDDFETFDIAISNPPFGRVGRSGKGPRYTGAEFEFHIIDLAAQFARSGVFIIPSTSAPFRYSGAQFYERKDSGRGASFEKATGIRLDVGCGVDCSIYKDDWQDVAPSVELVTADFETAKPVPQAEQTLFDLDVVHKTSRVAA